MTKHAPMPSYWSLVNEVTHLHGRLDTLEIEIGDLKEENADLLETLDDMEKRFIEEWNRACNAERENEKLRELVRYIMHQCNDGNPRCDECIDWNDGCAALERMRDLEVHINEIQTRSR